jgi:hypothetical protein
MRSEKPPGTLRTLFAVMTADRSRPGTFNAEVRGGRPGRTLAVIAVLAGIGVSFVLLFEAALYPWARSLTGGPTLVGEWQGELTTPTGQHRIVRFVVGPLNQTCATCSDIDATARMCDQDGTVSDFEAWGDTENWKGTRFTLETRKALDRPVGLKLGVLHGEWNRDIVRLTTTLRADPDTSTRRSERDAEGREQATVVGAHPDALAAVRITLRRASEEDFVVACRRLGASSVRQ